jgi:hypothetical protein
MFCKSWIDCADALAHQTDAAPQSAAATVDRLKSAREAIIPL